MFRRDDAFVFVSISALVSFTTENVYTNQIIYVINMRNRFYNFLKWVKTVFAVVSFLAKFSKNLWFEYIKISNPWEFAMEAWEPKTCAYTLLHQGLKGTEPRWPVGRRWLKDKYARLETCFPKFRMSGRVSNLFKFGINNPVINK